MTLTEGTFDSRPGADALADAVGGWGLNYGLGAVFGLSRYYSLFSFTPSVERSTVFGAQAGLAVGYTFGR